MAKYIRTKDGIIYVGDLIKDNYGNYCDPKNYETDIEVSNEYIIKEADTIEELCDEFVYANKSNENKTIYAGFVAIQSKISTMCEIAKTIKSDLYGAIWTDKGLIYVAKLNSKGELELIWN